MGFLATAVIRCDPGIAATAIVFDILPPFNHKWEPEDWCNISEE